MSVFASQPEFVNEEMFLTAAMENKLPVVDKYLADGGNPNVNDNVSVALIDLPLFSLYYLSNTLNIKHKLYIFYFILYNKESPTMSPKRGVQLFKHKEIIQHTPKLLLYLQ